MLGGFSFEVNYFERARYPATRKIILLCALEFERRYHFIDMTVGIHSTVPLLI
jgi:hypothetical protein